MSVLALDVAPISEFDHAKVDERFFVELQQRSIFDSFGSRCVSPYLPRLSFEQTVHIF